MRAFSFYALAAAAIILVIGAVAATLSPAGAREAIVISGVVALAVQLIAFGLARSWRRTNVMVGWGVGSLLRLVVMVCYALIVAKLWRAPLTPALLSLAGFLFATTLVEPLYLRR